MIGNLELSIEPRTHDVQSPNWWTWSWNPSATLRSSCTERQCWCPTTAPLVLRFTCAAHINCKCLGNYHIFSNVTYMSDAALCNRHSATNTVLVHDISDTDCQTQNGSIQSCISTTSKFLILNNLNHKLTAKLLCLLFISFVLITPMLLCLVSPLITHF